MFRVSSISEVQECSEQLGRDPSKFWIPPPQQKTFGPESPHEALSKANWHAKFEGDFKLKIEQFLRVATPAEPRGEEKKLFLCANFGRWKTFKISWKVPVK